MLVSGTSQRLSCQVRFQELCGMPQTPPRPPRLRRFKRAVAGLRPTGLVGRDFCAQQVADAVGYSLRGDRLEEAENIEGVLVLAPARDVDPFGNLMELGDKEGGGARDRYLEGPSVVYFQGFDDPLLPIDERGLKPSRLSGSPVAVRTETRSAAARTAYGFGHHEIDLFFNGRPSTGRLAIQVPTCRVSNLLTRCGSTKRR